jgi:Na+-translocating ferredoxin:NAD+ oxidoreductase RnfG subunit
MKMPRLTAPAAFVLAALGAALPAHATEYWDRKALLEDFFKQGEVKPQVSFKSFTLSDQEAAGIAQKLGVNASALKRDWSIYIGARDGQRVGFAVLDKEVGLHEYIDYGVKFGLNGAIERVEIIAYRENYGDQVRGTRYRSKFVGKTANDPIVAGKDIDIISGATYSSRSVALGVKRDTLVLAAALKNGAL